MELQRNMKKEISLEKENYNDIETSLDFCQENDI